MRIIGMLALTAAVSACAIHDGRNPNYRIDGETPYDSYRQARELALTTGKEPPRRVPVARPFDAPHPDDIRGPTLMQIIARDFRAATAQAGGVAPAVVVVADAPAAAPVSEPVVVVPPGAVVRSGPYPGSTPVLVRYAFAARHAPGTAVWARSGGSAERAARACALYPSAERAQLAFLAFGGPDADPRGMDPDGDGFVCGWNPADWRKEQL